MAEAKGVLLELASEKLKVPVTQLEVNDGIITDTEILQIQSPIQSLQKGKRLRDSSK